MNTKTLLEKETKYYNPWQVLCIVSAGLFLVGIDMTVLNVALPILTHELHATTAEKLWMVNVYSLVLAGLLPGCGALSDKIGHRKMFTIGLLIFGVSSTIAAFSTTAKLLIIARGILAIGAAIMLPATIAIIRIIFTKDKERAIAIGIWGSVSAGASAFGPLLGGFLLEHFWWGAVFLINIPVIIITLFFTYIKIPKIAADKSREFDALTSVFLTIMMIAFLYAIKNILKININWNEVLIATFVGVIFMQGFLKRQKNLKYPIIDFKLFQNSGFSIGISSAMFASFIMIGLQFTLSQELQLAQSFSPLQTGLFLLPIALGAFVAGPLIGAILFRVGINKMLFLTLFIAAAGLTLFIFPPSHLLSQILGLSMTGFGLGGLMSVASTSIMINAPEEKAGMAGALEGISYELGGTLGVAILGSIIASLYTYSFSPPTEINLLPIAWDSLDQTMILAEQLPKIQSEQIVIAGKTAFMNSVSITLIGTTFVIIALCFFMAINPLKYFKNQKD